MLLIAVALTGLALAAWKQFDRLRRLREMYEGEAYMYALLEESARANAGQSRDEWLAHSRELDRRNRQGKVPTSGGIRALVLPGRPPETQRRKAEYYAAQRRKYEHAARYPWRSVATDPPEPDE
jgi:hypothetical protein